MVQFLGTWEARKKRGVFLILACIYKYIEDLAAGSHDLSQDENKMAVI